MGLYFISFFNIQENKLRRVLPGNCTKFVIFFSGVASRFQVDKTHSVKYLFCTFLKPIISVNLCCQKLPDLSPNLPNRENLPKLLFYEKIRKIAKTAVLRENKKKLPELLFYEKNRENLPKVLLYEKIKEFWINTILITKGQSGMMAVDLIQNH